jgi:lathosterol oxidase
VLDSFYTTFGVEISRNNTIRQCISLWLIAVVGVNLLYFILSTISYVFFFDKSLKKHPKYLPNQIWQEICMSVYSFPITAIVTVPWFLFEVKGYSKLYNDDPFKTTADSIYFFMSIIMFIMFTDFGVYWYV